MELKFDVKACKPHVLALLAYLAIALVMFWNITLHVSTSVVNGGADTYQSLWSLWWVPYSMFTLHQSPYYIPSNTNHTMLYFPVGANLVLQPMSPLAGILTLPIQAIAGLPFTYNLLFFLGFVLSGLFMFMLARYIVKNDYAAFLAGLIFAFSPTHIAEAYANLQWTSIEFIPLFILCFLLLIRTKKWKYGVYSGIAFVFLAFFGGLSQGIIIIAFVVVSLLILLLESFLSAKEKSSVLNCIAQVSPGLIVFAVVAVLLSIPFLSGILPHLNGATSAEVQLDSVTRNILYSDNLVSFLLPSYYNGIFSKISLGYVNNTYGLTYDNSTYAPNITDRVSFLGYSVILLTLFALYHEHRKNRLKDAAYWIAIFVLFALLAVGPVLQVYSISTGIPTLYTIYRGIPFFNTMNEPGAFDIIVTVSLAILACMGFDHLSRSRYNKLGMLGLALLFTLLIFIEYNGMPFSSQSAAALTQNAQVPNDYQYINTLEGNFSVLSLPALPNVTTGSFLYPAQSMLYQTVTDKPLFGGYTTIGNQTQEQLLENVPLIASTAYLEAGDGFLYPYPIIENYSNLTLFWLTLDKVGIIAVDNNAFTGNESGILDSYLQSIFGPPVSTDSNATIFDSSAAEDTSGGKSPSSYLVGTWIPGYDFCNEYTECNQTLARLWWGNNTRGITIFTPNTTDAYLEFSAISGTPQGILYVFLNGDATPVQAINITTGLRNYTVALKLPEGLSQVAFYEPNNTEQESRVLGYGLGNIQVITIP